jgi:cytochrome c oxidase cbb3-type subunit 4
MDTYSLMREFADSWMLLAMTCFFLGVVVWAFRPGSKDTHRDTANNPFRTTVRPVPAHQKRPLRSEAHHERPRPQEPRR